MAHSLTPTLGAKPEFFNFGRDVIDYWASQSPVPQAMYHLNQDQSKKRILDYTHFARESRRISVFLERLGVKRGEVVLLILPRVVEWWEIAIACLRSGIILCPATTLLVEKDIEFRALETHASVFVGDRVSVAKFQKIRDHCSHVRHVIQVDEEAGNNVSEGVTDFHKEMKKVEKEVKYEGPKTKATDPAMIYFTSGTSGPPKMVLHNHVSYPLAHTITGKHWLQLKPGKIYWNLSEQGWAKAAWSFLATLSCGATLFIHDDRAPFSAPRLLQTLHSHPITTLCAPPTAYRQLVLRASQDYLKKNPPMKLERCTGAGEPLNDSVIETWKRMTGLEICDGYGQTETIMICGNFGDRPVRPGSMGHPSPGVPLFVISPDGTEAPVGEEGDIAILVEGRGGGGEEFFGIFEGYLSRDRKLDRRVVQRGGKEWYLTGDRAYRDREGYFWFVGRRDDVINSSGYRIGPFEVESTLKLHPGVIESAVVSSPDPHRHEVVKAFIVLTEEYAAKASQSVEAVTKEIQDFCKEHAAPYKYPRKVQFVDASYLPKTISGKIRRSELKAQEWKGWKGGKHNGKEKL